MFGTMTRNEDKLLRIPIQYELFSYPYGCLVFIDTSLVRTGIIYNISLQWRHNECDGVSNHRHIDCLFNRLFRRRSNKTSKLRVTGLCDGNPSVTGRFPSQKVSNAEKIPFDDVMMWLCQNVRHATLHFNVCNVIRLKCFILIFKYRCVPFKLYQVAHIKTFVEYWWILKVSTQTFIGSLSCCLRKAKAPGINYWPIHDNISGLQ